MRKTGLAATAVAVMGLTGCSAGPEYDSGRDLLEAVTDAGFDCEDASIFNRAPGQIVTCASGDRLAAADSAEDMLEDPAEVSDNLHGAFLIGETWMVAASNASVLESVQEELGGEITESNPLQLVSETCQRGHFIDYDDNYGVMTISGAYQSGFSVASDVFDCVSEELPIPPHIQDDISRTRALDGTRENSWDQFEASWTYHPDSGLNIQIQTTDD